MVRSNVLDVVQTRFVGEMDFGSVQSGGLMGSKPNAIGGDQNIQSKGTNLHHGP